MLAVGFRHNVRVVKILMIEHSEIGCGNCIHRNYDSFHDESWCGHNPKPDGLCPRLLVEHTDKCEYFEQDY